MKVSTKYFRYLNMTTMYKKPSLNFHIFMFTHEPISIHVVDIFQPKQTKQDSQLNFGLFSHSHSLFIQNVHKTLRTWIDTNHNYINNKY